LPGLSLNCNPPDFCLLSSWDYRCEPLVPSQAWFLKVILLPLSLAVILICLSWPWGPFHCCYFLHLYLLSPTSINVFVGLWHRILKPKVWRYSYQKAGLCLSRNTCIFLGYEKNPFQWVCCSLSLHGRKDECKSEINVWYICIEIP
jgi:hypothetical protein